MLDEKNKNFALDTGASGGIGREIAKILLEKSYDLLLVARALEKLEAIRAEFNSVASKQTVTVLQADLSRKASSKMIFDFANNKNMTIEILVNNAGAGTSD